MKIRIALFAALFLPLVFLGSACSLLSKRQPKKAQPKSESLYKESKSDIDKGRESDASTKLKEIVLNDPESELADDALISLGNLHFKRQEYEKAYDYYIQVVKSDIFSPKEVDALYLSGKSLFFLDRFDEAASLLEKSLDVEPIQPELKSNIYELLANTQLKLGDRVDAIDSLQKLSVEHPDPVKAQGFKSRGIKMIETELNNDELEHIAGRSSFGEFVGYAMSRLGRQKAERREFDEAARYYLGVTETLPGTEYANEAQRFLDLLKARRTVAADTIGVVLPLTGRYSSVAYKTLRGIQLALGIYGPNKSKYKLAVVDSEGNPDVARRAVEKLVIEDNVIAIVGSLLSRTATAVSETAHDFGVPTIGLSQKSGLTEIGDSVFRNSLTSEMQVRALVDMAMNQFGMRKFALLFPNDRYGVEYANLFWDSVLARGGQIVGAQPYKPKETDFRGPIRRLVGTYYIEDRITEYKERLKVWKREHINYGHRAAPPEDLLPPIVDFDALFIPDSTRSLGQIAPMLRFNDVSDITLLGTNLWNTRSVVRKSGELKDKVLFVDSLLSSDEDFKTSQFFNDYKTTFNKSPGSFEIHAYDATKVLRALLDAGVTSRKTVVESLNTINNYPGAYGSLTMNDRREIDQPVVALKIENNTIKKLDSSSLRN